MVSLTILQNKIKKNPRSYGPEFKQQLRHFDAQLSIFELSPPKDSKEFGRQVTFLSQVAHLYPQDSQHLAYDILNLLDKSYEAMDGDLRKTLFQALVLIRNRGNLDPVTLISLCFSLFRCQDKGLREMIYNHIIADVRNVNKKASNQKLNKAIQNVVYKMLEDPSSMAAKKSLQVMVDLYKRRVWIDARTVNVIAQACLSDQPKNVAIGLQFFLGIDEKIDALMEEEEEEAVETSLEASTGKSKEKLERAAQKDSKHFAKKTRKRERIKQKEMKALKKSRQAQNGSAESKRTNAPRFPAIELLNDPQGFAEKLFKKLKTSKDHFEVRLMMMNLISRVVGYHKLLLLPLYSFIQRYLQPHQRYVTAILAYLIQASHDLVPSEDLEPILKHIANNFVTDRSGAEVMAVGLNSIRELVAKVPLLTNGQGMDDFLQDLVLYKSYRRDKSVVIAARSLLNLVRELNPAVLQRKERGKFHNATEGLMEYGQVKVSEGVEGAELLQYLEEEAQTMANEEDEEEEEEEDDDDDDDDSSNDDDDDEEQEEEEEEKDNKGKRKKEKVDENETLLEKARKRKIPQAERIDAKRLLTDEDFRRIRKLKEKLEKEKRDPKARRKNAPERKKPIAANALLKKLAKSGFEIENEMEDASGDEDDDPFASDFSSSSEEESDEEMGNAAGAVDPSSLEGVIKQRRRELADRLASVHSGREGAHELANKKGGGSNNAAKLKNKDFRMVSKSDKVRRKQSVSLRQQQQQLKKHIKNIEKSKKTVQKVRRRQK